MTVRRMCIACWLPKTTNKHSEYLIIHIVFPLQQWLQERATMIRSINIACLELLKLRTLQVTTHLIDGIFIGCIREIAKAAVGSVMFVCVSVRPSVHIE